MSNEGLISGNLINETLNFLDLLDQFLFKFLNVGSFLTFSFGTGFVNTALDLGNLSLESLDL